MFIIVTLSTLSNLSLSELIKTARKTNNLTQTAFGKFFEPSIAQPTIARWEKGDLFPDRKHFPKIASLLNLTLEELLDIVHEQLEENENASRKLEEENYICDNRHLRVLNKGSKAWNRWRNKNDRILPQLEGAEPKEDYFDEIDLHGAYLRKSNFQGKSLKRAELRGADLSGADLSGADLSGADLRFANLTKSNLKKTNLSNANLSGANLSEAILVDAVLCDANLKQANLSNADLTHADIREANLNQANLECAILKYCYVYGISDWNTNLDEAVQKQLSICPYKTKPIYVDCIENARLKLSEINHRNDTKIFELARKLQNALSESKASFKEKLDKIQNLKGVEVKPEINGIPGIINIENNDKCKISRCIYHFQSSYFDTYCLIRIFEFSSKTIVIASQIWGTTGNNDLLLKNVIEDFKLDYDNLYWINHVGFFSDYTPEKEEYSRIVFTYKKDYIFSQKKLNIIDEIEISSESVENLIESSLELVESWIGLDSIAINKFRRERKEKTFRLLHLYLQENITALYGDDMIKILSYTEFGVVFFYPNQDRRFEFVKHEKILDNDNDSIKKVLPYIEKSFPSKEIVVCVCIDSNNYDSFCTIVKKEALIDSNNISFASLDKLLECDFSPSEIVNLNITRYREEIRNEDSKLQSLLNLYLKPKLDYLISRFEKEKTIFETETETLRGALFYYPEQNFSVFHSKQELPRRFKKLVLSSVDTYDIKSEVVICVISHAEQGVCGIFSRSKSENLSV